ncbi:MAG TPA: zf-HC2 domain-containing protein [Thermoanaerobaculia bacterium]|nr:zf-HC2 domain-containing protein [Thermoanaerobaculia bacterium]
MMHLGKGEIEGFLTGRLDAAERKRILHHLGGCSPCRRRLRMAAEILLGDEPWMAAEPVMEDQYDEALARSDIFARSLQKRWRKEGGKLEQALACLDQAPGGLGDESFPWRQAQALHGWPLCEALLRKSYEARFTDPKRMLSLAESAAGVAKHIKAEKYPWPGFVADLRARTFAELGNAYRVNDRFPEADQAFERAIGYLENGTGDPLLQARVLDLFASLRSAQRRLDDAIEMLELVYGLYLEAEDRHLAGRALISKGMNTRYKDYPREAVSLFERGLQLLERERDPQLASIGQQALLDALTDCGEYRQASALLLQSGLREAFAAEPLNLLKIRWLEGKIHAGLDRLEKAGRAFAEVRREYLRLDQVYEAALVGLELASVWLRQGRPAQVRELAEEMYQTLVELGVQPEAARALYFVREACLVQAVTVAMIEQVRHFLERLPWHPGLRFEPALFAT